MSWEMKLNKAYQVLSEPDQYHFSFTDNVLFFGCRNRKGDFYFEDEWEQLTQNRSLTLHTAFSRDQDDKIYVQHLITRQGESLYNLIKYKEAKIFVAG